MTKYLLLIVIALTIALGISVKTCKSEANKKNLYKGNQTALLKNASYYRTKDSLSVASIQRLQLTKKELEDNRGYLLNTIKLLNIKPNRVNSASTTGIKTDYSIKPTIRDSFIYRAGKIDTLRCVSFSDKWLTVSGCGDKNKFEGLIESRDTLIQIVHRIPHHIWFIKYGTKAVRQEVTSLNPHSTVVFTEYIELVK